MIENTTWTKYSEQMNKIFTEQFGYTEAVAAEFTKMREKGMGQMQAAMDDYSKLVQASVDYQTGLFADWQKMSMDAMRQTAEIMKPNQG